MNSSKPGYFILAVCILFAGCSAQKPAAPTVERPPAAESSTPSAQAPAAPPDTRPVIVTFGDSLTAGVAGRSYPEQLQDLLDANGFHYRVDNQGVSGDTSTDGLARVDNVIAAKPRLVLLEFGGNDGLRGVPVTATRKNMEEIIRRLQAQKIPIYLLGITLPPNYGPDYVKPFTAMFPALAREFHVPLMPFLLAHVVTKPGMMQPDGIHPNGDGNKIVARDVFELVKASL